MVWMWFVVHAGQSRLPMGYMHPGGTRVWRVQGFLQKQSCQPQGNKPQNVQKVLSQICLLSWHIFWEDLTFEFTSQKIDNLWVTLENIGLTPHNTFPFLGPLVSWPASGPWDRSCTKSVLIARCQGLLTCRWTPLLLVNKAFSFLTSVSFNKRFLSEAVLSPEFLYVHPVCELECMCSQLGERWIIDSALLSMDLSPNVSIRTTGRA